MMRLFFAIIFSLSTTSFAQQDLSLAQAIEKALANNYQIKLVNANYEISQLQNTWGMAGLSPVFTFNINNTNNLTDNTNNPATFF